MEDGTLILLHTAFLLGAHITSFKSDTFEGSVCYVVKTERPLDAGHIHRTLAVAQGNGRTMWAVSIIVLAAV